MMRGVRAVENALGCWDVSIWALSSIRGYRSPFGPLDSSVLVCRMGIILPPPAAQKGGGDEMRRLREQRHVTTGARHPARCALAPCLCPPV